MNVSSILGSNFIRTSKYLSRSECQSAPEEPKNKMSAASASDWDTVVSQPFHITQQVQPEIASKSSEKDIDSEESKLEAIKEAMILILAAGISGFLGGVGRGVPEHYGQLLFNHLTAESTATNESPTVMNFFKSQSLLKSSEGILDTMYSQGNARGGFFGMAEILKFVVRPVLDVPIFTDLLVGYAVGGVVTLGQAKNIALNYSRVNKPEQLETIKKSSSASLFKSSAFPWFNLNKNGITDSSVIAFRDHPGIGSSLSTIHLVWTNVVDQLEVLSLKHGTKTMSETLDIYRKEVTEDLSKATSSFDKVKRFTLKTQRGLSAKVLRVGGGVFLTLSIIGLTRPLIEENLRNVFNVPKRSEVPKES